MDIKEQFEKATKDVNTLSEKPDNVTLLKLYSLFKQATEGDVNGERPGGFDFKGTAKYDSWSELKGMDSETAMKKYIELVDQLLNK